MPLILTLSATLPVLEFSIPGFSTDILTWIFSQCLYVECGCLNKHDSLTRALSLEKALSSSFSVSPCPAPSQYTKYIIVISLFTHCKDNHTVGLNALEGNIEGH